MRAYQIFQNITPKTGHQIIEFLREEDKDSYRATLSSLAAQRRLRPIFIQKKTREAQAEWMIKNLQLRQCDGACEHLLQTWLMKGYQDVLVSFLDGVGIKHNGKGEVEDLPEEIDEKKLKETSDKLLEEYDDELIAIYFHMFNLQRVDGWESLTALLKSESRLHIGEQPEPELTPEPESKQAPPKKKAAAKKKKPAAEKEEAEPEAEETPAEQKAESDDGEKE